MFCYLHLAVGDNLVKYDHTDAGVARVVSRIKTVVWRIWGCSDGGGFNSIIPREGANDPALPFDAKRALCEDRWSDLVREERIATSHNSTKVYSSTELCAGVQSSPGTGTESGRSKIYLSRSVCYLHLVAEAAYSTSTLDLGDSTLGIWEYLEYWAT